ncbi:c-type cytochrome [Trinickia dinghuensis]|uniref:Cytochrome c n=1 Tax=Trinickia dinghuensis TaxID=2291023 RepID=A0A3D8JPN3_9BURK|nr:cytochrome c [Trinickia dinghuensis]RDU94977.1 cytochrome c [Trinickia dinghuensis]
MTESFVPAILSLSRSLARVGAGIALAVSSALALAQGSAGASADVVKQGAYLARAGDCIACHTQPGDKLFAGGRAMPTPFGTLYSPNITPDDATGIGKWTADEFYRMMHTGRSRDGSLLYPAMPYGAYTKVTRADSDAIFAYLRSVPPVDRPNRPHELRFPYNNRELLLGWRTLYFREGEYQADPTRSVEWNRGSYLVQGLGHCSMCHTAINALGGSSESKAFEGGLIPMQDWYAPSLTSNKEAGLGDWSIGDIADLLQKGVSNRGAVYGPMAEVVYDSLQYLSDDDVRAMAVYLKSLPQHGAQSPAAKPGVSGVSGEERDLLAQLGSKIYDAQCATCHGKHGDGKLPDFPPLANNQSIQMTSAVNPIRMVLNGGYAPGTAKNPSPYGMPPFAQSLSDEEVAAVVTFIRTAWGNHGTPVTAKEANALRSAPLY